MKLEMGHIYIKDIQFATESKIEDGILYVSEEAVRAVALEDEKIKSASFDIAKPGESVRITPVKLSLIHISGTECIRRDGKRRNTRRDFYKVVW